jgi:flagellar hook-associated protein 1 FlgK
MSLLGIGISGLNISQTALQVTGNNIANAENPSYSRQRVETATLPEQLRGSGFVGAGAIVNDISRVVDQFLITQVQLDTGSFNNLQIFAENIGQVDSLLADDFSGLGPAISDFFSAIEASSLDPASEPARQAVISQADALAQRVNTLTSRVTQQSESVNNQITSLTTQVSTLASGLAQLNLSISDEVGRGAGAEPNQLLDQRDELLKQLSELVGVTTVKNGNSLDIFVGNGQPLVVGGVSANISTTLSAREFGNVEVTFTSDSGAEQEVTDFISGGKIGGLLEFRDDVVTDVVNSLGRIALGLADSLNQQNRLGIDLDGELGGNIFRDINDSSIVTQRAIVDSNNSDPGNQSLSVIITDISQLTISDYVLTAVDNKGDAFVDYQLTRTSDNTSTFIDGTGPGLAQSLIVDGFSINIPATTPGNLALGDRFYIRPTRAGGEDMQVEMTRVQDLAYAVPLSVESNSTAGGISSGVIIALEDDSVFNFAQPPASLPLTNPVYSSAGIIDGEVLISFTSATDYTVYGNADATAPEILFRGSIIPGQENSIFDEVPGSSNYTGFQFEISGLPRQGDEFKISSNLDGTSDNRNGSALGSVRTMDILDGGSTNFENAYGSLIEEVGTRTAQAQISRDASESLLVQSQSNRDSMSGVNLDEEAGNLIKFEQSYNASAQIITIARQIFDTLLGVLR